MLGRPSSLLFHAALTAFLSRLSRARRSHCFPFSLLGLCNLMGGNFLSFPSRQATGEREEWEGGTLPFSVSSSAVEYVGVQSARTKRQGRTPILIFFPASAIAILKGEIGNVYRRRPIFRLPSQNMQTSLSSLQLLQAWEATVPLFLPLPSQVLLRF